MKVTKKSKLSGGSGGSKGSVGNVDGAAGYSKRTLAQKLGCKDGMSKAFLYAPSGFAEQVGIAEGDYDTELELGTYDFIVFFTASRVLLQNMFPILAKRLFPGGSLWIAWPKKASKGYPDRPPTDVSENLIREIGLPTGLVDIKVIAVDPVWSGLKFVHRAHKHVRPDFEQPAPLREIPPVERFGL